MKVSLALTLLFCWLHCAMAPRIQAAPGQVYMVLGSDTAVWNAPGGIAVAKYRGTFNSSLFIQPSTNAYKVMNADFRNQFLDGFGQPLKLTWWMLVGSVYGKGLITDVPVPNLMPLHLMRQYHGRALQTLGDELTLHYHTFLWSDYNGDGAYYWNEAQTFHECRDDWDQALAQSLIEEEVFPVSFRSGWHFMDNEWQQYLNELLPYNMDDDSPLKKAWTTQEPTFNVLDWSKAPTNFVPYHPAPDDYQIPGESPGWNVRSVKFPNVTQAMVNDIFAKAAAGQDQVVSFWGHLAESDFLANIAKMDTLTHAASGKFPEVPWRYCTAVEAMQRWLLSNDQNPPRLEVLRQEDGETVTLTLRTTEPIYQKQPFVAVKDIYQRYSVVPCQAVDTAVWTAELPVPRSRLAKVGIAVTDQAGNLTTKILRYLPDDLFVDNLDTDYSEAGGAWKSTATAAWGIDARVAVLTAKDTATARWALPVTESRKYTVLVQVPAVANPAGHVGFALKAGDATIQTVYFDRPLPAKQWVPLGEWFLDAAQVNTLEMTVSGAGQANTVAVADVVKVTPMPLASPNFITDVAVDAADTTATLTWTTASPATGLVEYGADASLGRFSATNSALTVKHVATLTGFKPETAVKFQIQSDSGGQSHFYQGSFTTTPVPQNGPAIRLVELANVWKYSAANLDTEKGWKAPDFDDSSWAEGPGLLWVDTRPTGGTATVQPKNTEMPSNPDTKFPFGSYYFRTRFQFTNDPATATLVFTNYIDDGAVFYLNGVEIQRNNLPAAPTGITNTTLASAFNCSGDATCAVVFKLSGKVLTNLVVGNNLLAVEVHNYNANSPDITFGSAVSATTPGFTTPRLGFLCEGETTTLYWNGTGFRLQWAEKLGDNPADWSDLPDPAAVSPYSRTDLRTGFYRLKGSPKPAGFSAPQNKLEAAAVGGDLDSQLEE